MSLHMPIDPLPLCRHAKQLEHSQIAGNLLDRDVII